MSWFGNKQGHRDAKRFGAREEEPKEASRETHKEVEITVVIYAGVVSEHLKHIAGMIHAGQREGHQNPPGVRYWSVKEV